MFNKLINDEMNQEHKYSLYSLEQFINLGDKYLSREIMPDTELAHVTLFFLAKFHKSLLSFRMLVVSGFEEDARVVLRTLIESLLSLIYMSKQPEKRVRLFIEYQYVAWYRLLNQLDRHYGENANINPERRADIIRDYNKVKHNYQVKSRWYDRDLRKIADDIGPDALYWYESVYGVDSCYVHSSVSSARGFLTILDDGVAVATGPRPFKATDILSKTCEITRSFLIQVCRNWLIPQEEVIEVWEQALKLLQKEIKEISGQ